jgi:hypothetical protein
LISLVRRTAQAPGGVPPRPARQRHPGEYAVPASKRRASGELLTVMKVIVPVVLVVLGVILLVIALPR